MKVTHSPKMVQDVLDVKSSLPSPFAEQREINQVHSPTGDIDTETGGKMHRTRICKTNIKADGCKRICGYRYRQRVSLLF